MKGECTRRTDTVCGREKDENNSKVPRIPKISTGTVFTRPPVKNKTTTTKKKRLKSPTIRVSTEPGECVEIVFVFKNKLNP